MSLISSENIIQSGKASTHAWSSFLSSSLEVLRRLAGATEHEFLQIGAQIQGIYQNAIQLSQTAHDLVENASGEHIQVMVARLLQILGEMEEYLMQAQLQSSESCTTLETVQLSLHKVKAPLEMIKKMCKHLYIFEVSIKIESAYIGDMGSEFINLAIDIKKLSQQIKEKVVSINNHCMKLKEVLALNGANLHAARSAHETKADLTLANTTASLSELETFNERFSLIGSSISSISEENSFNLSEIIQSMQFHDIFRQQIEHVIEALEGVAQSVGDCRNNDIMENNQAIIIKIGDVCEIQEAQLKFASEELFTAVTLIVDNLQDISTKQRQMARDIYLETKANELPGSSFIEEVSHKMGSLADLLTDCTENNNEVVSLMQQATSTVKEITGFVSGIEEIGDEIIQIALNARVKASGTGKEGASLSVLAEEIGQLSNDAVQYTDLITKTLTEIDSITQNMSIKVLNNKLTLEEKLTGLKVELNEVLSTFDVMGSQVFSQLAQIRNQVQTLTEGIENITNNISFHEQMKDMADDVMCKLKKIISQARLLYPASSEFKEDLRQIAQHYTMESERRIHEAIANKHNAKTNRDQPGSLILNVEKSESEFGDNVDLF